MINPKLLKYALRFCKPERFRTRANQEAFRYIHVDQEFVYAFCTEGGFIVEHKDKVTKPYWVSMNDLPTKIKVSDTISVSDDGLFFNGELVTKPSETTPNDFVTGAYENVRRQAVGFDSKEQTPWKLSEVVFIPQKVKDYTDWMALKPKNINMKLLNKHSRFRIFTADILDTKTYAVIVSE